MDSQNKKEQVEQMFDSIATRYDFLNHLLSLGIDRRWRKRLARKVKADSVGRLLDVATGTGDMAVELYRVGLHDIVGVDMSEGMLSVARQKFDRAAIKIELIQGRAEELPVESNHFDAVTCAFGVRNFADTVGGLRQMCRVLNEGKKCYVLEYSKAEKRTLIGSCFKLYFRYILPRVGGWISGNRAAYSYLPDSVENFAAGEAFCDLMREAGFVDVRYQTLFCGWVTIYEGTKR